MTAPSMKRSSDDYKSSFDFEDWRQERKALILSLKVAWLGDPEANAAGLEALDKMDTELPNTARARPVKHDLLDVLAPERKKPRQSGRGS